MVAKNLKVVTGINETHRIIKQLILRDELSVKELNK